MLPRGLDVELPTDFSVELPLGFDVMLPCGFEVELARVFEVVLPCGIEVDSPCGLDVVLPWIFEVENLELCAFVWVFTLEEVLEEAVRVELIGLYVADDFGVLTDAPPVFEVGVVFEVNV